MSVMDIQDIKKILPHRYPFLLVDRVDEIVPGPDPAERVGRKAFGRKNVTINEEFFNGHFPHRAVMPGVLQIEAMAQVGGLCCHLPEQKDDFELFIASLNNVKFRKPVVPGDTLIIEAEILKDRRIKGDISVVQIACKVKVDDKVVSSMDLLAHIHKKF